MRRNKSRGSLIFLFILIILGYFFVYRPIVNIKAKANIVIASAKDLKSIFAKNDIELLKTKMEDFSNKYQNLQKAAKPIYWASLFHMFPI